MLNCSLYQVDVILFGARRCYLGFIIAQLTLDYYSALSVASCYFFNKHHIFCVKTKIIICGLMTRLRSTPRSDK